MKKLQRIWRAFVAAFWSAWREVPPPENKPSELKMHLACDSSEMEAALDRVLAKLERIKSLQQESALMTIPQVDPLTGWMGGEFDRDDKEGA